MPTLRQRIEHVVVLMLENRSFDHMLGLMPGVDGLLGPDGKPNPRFVNHAEADDPKSKAYPAGPGAPYAIAPEDIDRKGFGGPSHSFPAASVQAYGDKNGPSPAQLAAPAPLDGFIESYIRELSTDVHRSHPSEAEIRVPMASFEAGRLPVLWALAQEFCVCDRWFSEVPGPTQPNRLFVHAATSQGFTHNVWSHPFDVDTVYDELDKAGRDWAFFYFDLSDSNCFPRLKSRTDRVLQFDAFYEQAKGGRLPAYSFLCPRYAGKQGEHPSSQHAPFDVRYGEALIADVYEALRNGPDWGSTLLVVTYDEHGGFYDHVPPPANGVKSPDGLSSPTESDRAEAQRSPKNAGYLLEPDYVFDFTRLGLRVPAVLVSPWLKKGRVDSTPYQHTSILATLRDLFGTGKLTKRDAQAKSFASLLGELDTPRADAPAKLARPPLPATGEKASAAAMAEPMTEPQRDLWPMLSQLDGHKDSGKVTKPPPTRAEAQKYLDERLAANERYHRERRRKAAYEVFRDGKGKYRFRLRGDDGEVLVASAAAYASKEEAEARIRKLRDLAACARQVDVRERR